MNGAKRLRFYLKCLLAGVFNWIFAAAIVTYCHMAAYVSRYYSGSNKTVWWDLIHWLHPVWWVVISISIVAASAYREFHKPTSKPTP